MKNKKLLRWLRGRRIAVLKGGWSRERPISLLTGKAVEASLRRLGLRPIGIDVKPDILRRLQENQIQFCFLALHGAFGEDGQIQSCLDLLGIPYTGSGAAASELAMDKIASKHAFVRAGVPTPAWKTVTRQEFKSHPARIMGGIKTWLARGPLFLKPFDQGSAIGAVRIDKISQLRPALKTCFKMSGAALIERFIAGRELTVGILGNRALPVVEIIPKHAFYDFHSKYAKGGSRHVAPARIPSQTARLAQSASLKAFQSLGCAAYGRVDLLMKPNGELSVLEVNTIPGMTATSLLPDAARAAGINFDELVLTIIDASLKARGQKL